MFAMDKHSSLCGPFVSYEEKSLREYPPPPEASQTKDHIHNTSSFRILRMLQIN